jgi:hypothetical protein
MSEKVKKHGDRLQDIVQIMRDAASQSSDALMTM